MSVTPVSREMVSRLCSMILLERCDEGEPDIIMVIPHVVVGHACVSVHRFSKDVYLMFGDAGRTQCAEKTQFVGTEIATDSTNYAVFFSGFLPDGLLRLP